MATSALLAPNARRPEPCSGVWSVPGRSCRRAPRLLPASRDRRSCYQRVRHRVAELVGDARLLNGCASGAHATRSACGLDTVLLFPTRPLTLRVRSWFVIGAVALVMSARSGL